MYNILGRTEVLQAENFATSLLKRNKWGKKNLGSSATFLKRPETTSLPVEQWE